MTTTGVKHKLTVVFRPDVAAYSLLMADDAEATPHTLTACREVFS